LGVDVQTGVKVERLEQQGSQVSHVHTSQGVFQADVVVSSLDILRTHELLGKTTRLERLEPSLSGFVLLLGISGKTPTLSHHTISFSNDYPTEFKAIRSGQVADDPTLYFNVSSKSDPSDSPDGSENWFVMANAPARREGQMLDEKAYAKQLIEVMEARGLQVKGRVQMQHVLGPDYLATFAERGSIYGTAPHSLLTTLRPKQTLSGIKNLVLAGGTVYPGGGIPLSLLSGKSAAELACQHFS
jgi:phytoene dehydrogenase-like protein